MRSLTFAAAVSVSVITIVLLCARAFKGSGPGRRRQPRRQSAVRRMPPRPAPPGTACGRPGCGTRPPRRRRRSSTKPSTSPQCRLAHQVGVRLGQLAERAVGEGHDAHRRRARPPPGRSRAGPARRSSASSASRARRPLGGRRRGPAPARPRPASSGSRPAGGGGLRAAAGQHGERRRARGPSEGASAASE